MKQFSKQFKKEAEKISLNSDEQVVLREKVLAFMKYHPLPSSKMVNNLNKNHNFLKQADGDWMIIDLKKWHIFKWSSLALILTLTTIPYLAENSVPGDSLYAVKVNFNEEVRSSLAFNSYNKIVWEAERLNRRIAEVNLLTSEGKMTEEIENGVVEAVKNHRERAKKEIENLKQSDKDGAALIAVQLDAIIDIQSVSLKKAAETNSSSSLSSKIVKVLGEESEVNKELYSNISISWERLVAQVDKETKKAYELSRLVEKNINKKDQSSLKRHLEDISRKINFASEKKETSNEEAKRMLFEVLSDTQKLIVVMSNSGIKTELNLEEVVPITLTTEERLSEVLKEIKNSENLLDKLTKISHQDLNSEISDKIKEAINLTKKELEETKLLLNSQEDSIDEIEKKSDNALQILTDASDLVKSNLSLLEKGEESEENATNETPSSSKSIKEGEDSEEEKKEDINGNSKNKESQTSDENEKNKKEEV